jgi:hypothetical protein
VAELNTFFDPVARQQQGDTKRGCGDAENRYFIVCQQIKRL